MSNKKVSIFLPCLTGGGAENVALRIANGLAERGHKVDLVLGQRKGPYLSMIRPAVNLIDLKCSDGFVSLKSLGKLICYLKKNRPQVLFSTLFRANFVVSLALSLSGVRTRLVVRHPNMLYPEGSQENLYGRLIKILAIRAASKADAVILTSGLMKDELTNLASFKESRLHVIPNPVPVEEIQEKSLKQPDHEWFKAGELPVIVSVGRLTSQKGYVSLIKAFAEVIKENPAKLLILGEGEQRNELEALIKELELEKSVSLAGFVSNPYQYMVRAKVFALPSRWEGFPNVLVEAMACGAQVVATDCPGGSSEILEKGKWGSLVKVDDVPALASALAEGVRASSSIPTRERVNDFTVDIILSKYEKVFGLR